jgi:hypothetical protein
MEPVRRSWKVIVRFAAIGFAIAAAGYIYSELSDLRRPLNALDSVWFPAMLILCPPSALAIMCIDCEQDTSAAFSIWLLAAVLNGGLYALITAMLVRLRKARQDRQTKSAAD